MARIPLTLALLVSALAYQLCAVDPAPAVARSDQQFVEKAYQNGLVEVRSSQLALKRAIGGEEQGFAQQMVDDHSKANRELADIAARKDIAVPTVPDMKHEEMLEKLESHSAKTFSRGYVWLQLEAHKEAVDLFSTESADGKDADLRTFASNTLPTLQMHLARITAIWEKYDSSWHSE